MWEIFFVFASLFVFFHHDDDLKKTKKKLEKNISEEEGKVFISVLESSSQNKRQRSRAMCDLLLEMA